MKTMKLDRNIFVVCIIGTLLPKIFGLIDEFPPPAFEPHVPVNDVTHGKERVSRVQLTAFAAEAIANAGKAENENRVFFNNGIDKLVSEGKGAFGPHLLTGHSALAIGKVGSIFVDISTNAAASMNLEAPEAAEAVIQILPRILPFRFRCPFTNVTCDTLSAFRTVDGSCNNLFNTLWGSANTPFERTLPAIYGDGISTPRTLDSTDTNLLPGARTISTGFHKPSLASRLMPDITHFSMEFGQFISHDMQKNALSKGYLGSNVDCCNAFLSKRRSSCFPIDIPSDDSYFSQFNRTCMNFVRALPTPSLQCTLGCPATTDGRTNVQRGRDKWTEDKHNAEYSEQLHQGPREQLNENTHFIDGSQIYGSDISTATSLRAAGGKLLSTGNDDLLPKDTDNNSGCRLPPNDPNIKCFLAGDVRVNQHPALITLQTIWMREHNQLVDELHVLNPAWDGEKLYQEARKLVGAMLQHITYNEYLPDILGPTAMSNEDLSPLVSGYFTGYNSSQNPAIVNSFATAAFRFGHSKVHDSLAYHGTTNSNHLFKDVFLKPDLLYGITNGVTPIVRGLVETRSQKVDRYFSTQLSHHMFEKQPGTGLDLAAINIQRGRDHGIGAYIKWRQYCRLSLVSHFGTGTAGLVDHNPTCAAALESIYQSVNDIDLFSGAVSEIPVPGGKLGPTLTCLVAEQFKRMKYGDRFYYESNNPNVKFSPGQLHVIRKQTMAKIICRNTDISSIQRNVFMKQAPGNMAVNCNSLSSLNLKKWTE